MAVTRASADFYLRIQEVLYPFLLSRNEQGQKAWNDGLAPMLAPQVRTEGFGYEHVPPEIEVIAAVETFSGGAGFDLARGTTNRYNFTRGIDLSWDDVGVVALKRRATLESDDTAIAAAPSKFFLSSLGFFMLAGAYIYEWDLTTTSWVQRDDATGTFSGAVYTDINEIDGTLVAARGGAADYKTSTDGITWTAFTAEDENADVVTVRGNGSDVAAMWKVNDNLIKVNTAPAASGWTGGDEVGHTSETTRSAVTVDNDIYVFKDRGFYVYTGTETQDLWKTDYVDSQNGKNAYLWANRKIYVTYGDELLEFDPYGDTALGAVFPTAEMDSRELRGQITAVGGDTKRLCIALKNRAGNTYILKGRPNATLGRWVWHTIAYLGANDCNALHLTAPGVMHATNPALVLGYGTAANYIVLPRGGMHPSEDPACTYETSVSDSDRGVMYGAHKDWGAKTFPKFLNRGAVLGFDLSAGRAAELYYEADRSGTEVALVEATANGLSEANQTSEVSFQILRDILYMGTGDETVSPAVDGWLLAATLNPPRRRMWQPVVVLGTELEMRDGAGNEASAPDAATMRRILFASVTKRIELVDRDGTEYIVRLHDVIPVAIKDQDTGGREDEIAGYQLVLTEISTLTSDEQVGVYDESSYDSGHVYGDV